MIKLKKKEEENYDLNGISKQIWCEYVKTSRIYLILI